MSKYCTENVIMKKKYYDRTKTIVSEKTICQIAKAIEKFDKFTNYQNFKLWDFSSTKKYIKYLKDEKLALNTQSSYLKHLRDFFIWLSDQPGYKSKINRADTKYIALSHNEMNSLKTQIPKEYPTFEQAKAIFNVIKPQNEVKSRNKALMALAILTGMRVDSLRTLKIGDINLDKMEIIQVNAKFGKEILSKIFNFDTELKDCFLEWLKYLKEEKLYGNSDPVFPKNKQTQSKENLSFVYDEVEPLFWQSNSSISKIFKENSKMANLPPFSPHKYRHLSIYLAYEKVKSTKHPCLVIKALSQHFGHKDIRTSLEVYAPLSRAKLSEILNEVNNQIDEYEMEDIEDMDEEAQELVKRIMYKLSNKKPKMPNKKNE